MVDRQTRSGETTSEMNDETLTSLLEQAEMILEAFLLSLPSVTACEACPAPDLIERCAGKTLEAEQVVPLIRHLASCADCRAELRRWRNLRAAESGEGVCRLGGIRELMESKPDRGAHALAEISKRISGMVRSEPPEAGKPAKIEIAVVDPRGEPLGEWLTIVTARGPRIDSLYRFSLDIESWEPEEGESYLRLRLKDAEFRIEIGAVPLTKGVTEVLVDLSDLGVKPGYLSLENLEIIAECGERGVHRARNPLVESGTRLTLTLPFEITNSGVANGTWPAVRSLGYLGGKAKQRPSDGGKKESGKRRKRADEEK
jgi:hypothetical protein